MVGDGEWIAMTFVAELELAFVISAPQIVRPQAIGKRRAFGSVLGRAMRFTRP